MSVRIQQLIRLVSVTSLDTDAQMSVRDIRNQASVRAASHTDHLISVNEHLYWLNQLKQSGRQLAFAVLTMSGQPLGVGSLKNLDKANKTADWGIFVSESSRRDGLGFAAGAHLVDFAFGVLGLEKLNAEIIDGNDASFHYHEKLGFFEEGVRRANVVRNGKRTDVHLLGIEKVAWDEKKTLILQNAELRFAVKIDWSGAEGEALSPIDQIEAARARNNLNWMSILRIALERSPETSKQIVSEIKKIDQEISALTQKLME